MSELCSGDITAKERYNSELDFKLVAENLEWSSGRSSLKNGDHFNAITEPVISCALVPK